MQRIFAFIFILGTSPFLLITLLTIWIIEGETPVFMQERVGKDKTMFLVYKVRSMKSGKITFLGRIIRKTGIDEIPQLFNILKGEMNFVGPRPLTQSDIVRLGWNTKHYEKRWSINPGITGLAQLSPVCDAKISWENDQLYIAKRSIWLDLKIIWKSMLVPVIGKQRTKQLIHKEPNEHTR
ncbi:MAG: sugar transferase [Crocinitomicaceae bacterium]|nr:sugar transferase [Crocinitomicaceae bacterium]